MSDDEEGEREGKDGLVVVVVTKSKKSRLDSDCCSNMNVGNVDNNDDNGTIATATVATATAPAPAPAATTTATTTKVKSILKSCTSHKDDKHGQQQSPLHGQQQQQSPLHVLPVQLLIPFVTDDDIEIIGTVGYGRNGCCFKVNWNGQLYAMKQFDIGRNGCHYYRKELLAYITLHKVWGILVPQPIFVSESISRGVVFLGLQLGQKLPTEEVTDEIMQQFNNNVLKRIEDEYGIQHNDPDCSNMVYITDANGIERMVAIDFDHWQYV